MTDNVIKFPKEKKKPPTEEREIVSPDDEIEFITLDIVDMVFSELSFNGIDLETLNINNLKDLGLLTESIRSMVYRYYGKEHFMHKLTDNLFDAVGEDEITVNTRNTIAIIKNNKEHDVETIKGETLNGPTRPESNNVL